MTEASSVVLPGEVEILSQDHGHACRTYLVRETKPHTDQALLSYCGASAYLGGRVERIGNDIRVYVYID